MSILLDTQEDALDIQVHDFRECALRVLVEGRSPRSASIREQDIYMVGVLANFSDQALDLGGFGDIGWDRNGLAFEWECIEGSASFLARGGFARCDEDLRATGLD